MALDNEVLPEVRSLAEKLDKRLREAIAVKEVTKTSLVAGKLALIPIKLSMSTFELPLVEASQVAYLEPYLDTSVESLLEDTLDWVPPGWKSPGMMRLWPLCNGGNGDCFFRAISMALWGYTDEHEVLQKLMAKVLEHDEKLLYDVWKKVYHMEEHQNEWKSVMKYSLEYGSPQFYFFVMANILRRPIVHISDEYCRREDMHYIESEKLDSTIFLPTLLEPDECCPTPLVTGQTCIVKESGKSFGHATTLVGVHGHLTHVRLVEEDGALSSIRFGKRGSWINDVKAYMSVEEFRGTDGKMYYLAKVDESKVVALHTLDLAENLKRKHENDRTDDDNSRRKMRRVESHPVSSVDGGGRGNETSEDRPPTPPPVSSVDDEGGPGSEGREVRPPTSPPVSSIDDGGGPGSVGREVRPPTPPASPP